MNRFNLKDLINENGKVYYEHNGGIIEVQLDNSCEIIYDNFFHYYYLKTKDKKIALVHLYEYKEDLEFELKYCETMVVPIYTEVYFYPLSYSQVNERQFYYYIFKTRKNENAELIVDFKNGKLIINLSIEDKIISSCDFNKENYYKVIEQIKEMFGGGIDE